MHNQHSVKRFLLLALVGLLALGLVGIVPALFIPALHTAAQGQNLLQDPGFEGTYAPFAGDNTRLVAPGWSAWNIDHQPGQASYVNLAPEYRASTDKNRVHGGSASQEIFTVFGTHQGGVFQRVPVAAGNSVHFTVFSNVWSTSLDDPTISAQPGNAQIRVGIDPTGGVDGSSSSIVWSTPQQMYDKYVQMSVDATASADFVTVFVEGSQEQPVKHNNEYVDDASLTILGAEPTATATTTATIADTATSTATATVPLTWTPTSTATETTTGVPTQEGTIEPSATGSLPTDTPTDTAAAPAATTVPAVTFTPSPAPTEPNLPGRILYTVQYGDTVSGLADRFDSTITAIESANGLDDSGLIYIGQQLIIPVPFVPTATPTTTPILPTTIALPTTVSSAPVDNQVLNGPTVGGIGTYIVQPGDSLAAIANHYHISLWALALLNGILNPNLITQGQVLVVPGPGNNTPPLPLPGGATAIPGGATALPAATAVAPTPTTVPVGQVKTHVVQPGETLYMIASEYNVSVAALMQLNGLANPNVIYVGQVIFIPG